MSRTRRVAATIRGDLASASPIELGQFMLLGRKTGALHLVQKNRQGTLYFDQGDIVAAVGPDLRGGESAAMDILRWEEGDFHFVPEPVSSSKEITCGTQNLLLETARKMDEEGLESTIKERLKEVDELGELFAAITTESQDAPPTESADLAWLLAEPGREVLKFADQPAVRVDADGAWSAENTAVQLEPARLVPAAHASGPFEGWTRFGDTRLYVSWGADGFRVMHPFPAPTPADHLEETESLGQTLGSPSSIAIYGPKRSGKSLLAAVLARRLAAQSAPILIVTGIPHHDLQEGYRVFHEVVGAEASFDRARALARRWRPQVVVLDVDPTPDATSFLRECRTATTRIVATVGAAEGQPPRERVRSVIGATTGWQIVAPWPVGPGPRLEVSLDVILDAA